VKIERSKHIQKGHLMPRTTIIDLDTPITKKWALTVAIEQARVDEHSITWKALESSVQSRCNAVQLYFEDMGVRAGEDPQVTTFGWVEFRRVQTKGQLLALLNLAGVIDS
jgi:hypothetical protein